MIRRSLSAFGVSMFIAGFALVGCGGSTTGENLLGSGGSAGSSSGGSGGNASGGSAGNGSGGSGGGQACGATTCKQGEKCCGTPNCGVCVPQANACPPLNCPVSPNDAGPPVPCGGATCPAGQACCDATCGACSGPGGVCPGVSPCTDCNPQDALGVGTCPTQLGYAWDGSSCDLITGCSCQGSDCHNLFPDLDSCYVRYSGCMPAGA